MQVATNPEATARANLERKLSSSISLQQPLTTAVEKHISTAKAASTSPEATARSDLEPKPHGRVQQQTKAISSDRLDSGAPYLESLLKSTLSRAHLKRGWTADLPTFFRLEGLGFPGFSLFFHCFARFSNLFLVGGLLKKVGRGPAQPPNLFKMSSAYIGTLASLL